MKLTISNPVTIHARKPLTKKQRAELFAAHGGKCCVCQIKIGANEPWIDEHWNPLWRGGGNELANRAPAHVACATDKTSAETTDRAKVKRIQATINGTRRERKPIQSRPLQSAPFYKHPTKKRGFDGKVVER